MRDSMGWEGARHSEGWGGCKGMSKWLARHKHRRAGVRVYEWGRINPVT